MTDQPNYTAQQLFDTQKQKRLARNAVLKFRVAEAASDEKVPGSFNKIGRTTKLKTVKLRYNALNLDGSVNFDPNLFPQSVYAPVTPADGTDLPEWVSTLMWNPIYEALYPEFKKASSYMRGDDFVINDEPHPYAEGSILLAQMDEARVGHIAKLVQDPSDMIDREFYVRITYGKTGFINFNPMNELKDGLSLTPVEDWFEEVDALGRTLEEALAAAGEEVPVKEEESGSKRRRR